MVKWRGRREAIGGVYEGGAIPDEENETEKKRNESAGSGEGRVCQYTCSVVYRGL